MSRDLVPTDDPTPATAPTGRELVQSVQYDLFATFFGDPADLSNTIEFWDAIPKYCVTARQQAAMRQAGKILPLYKQDFHWEPQPRQAYNTRKLTLTLAPCQSARDLHP